MARYQEFVRKHAEARWDRELGRVHAAIERFTAAPSTLDAIAFNLLPTATLAWGPQRVLPAVSRIAPLLGPAMAAREGPDPKSARELGLGSFANLVACCGLPDETEPLAGWLSGIQTSKADQPAAPHWNRAFAALALDQRKIYRTLGGADPNQPMQVTPPALFGDNLPGFLRHLAGAAERGAGWPAVERAWHDLVENLQRHEEARTFDRDTPFWIARVVHHRIGRAKLGSVAQWLHDQLAAA